MRRENWVGRECEEERGGGVVGLAASASKGTGLVPLGPALLLCLVLQLHGPSASQDHVSHNTEMIVGVDGVVVVVLKG